jgi:catechol 2,3-dioxygenase-like lactoylglutathione lyase family enzyme
MAKIKHIAIATRDLEGTAAFYQEVLGLQLVGRDDVGHTAAVFLSDGDVNVTLLYFRNDEAALHDEGMRFIGLHHVGFVMGTKAEYDVVVGKLRQRNAKFLHGGPVGGSGTYFEVKAKDPNGITFDVSLDGWPGISHAADRPEQH